MTCIFFLFLGVGSGRRQRIRLERNPYIDPGHIVHIVDDNTVHLLAVSRRQGLVRAQHSTFVPRPGPEFQVPGEALQRHMGIR